MDDCTCVCADGWVGDYCQSKSNTCLLTAAIVTLESTIHNSILRQGSRIQLQLRCFSLAVATDS